MNDVTQNRSQEDYYKATRSMLKAAGEDCAFVSVLEGHDRSLSTPIEGRAGLIIDLVCSKMFFLAVIVIVILPPWQGVM